MRFRIPIGLVAQMTVDPPGDLPYILVPTLYLGLRENNELSLGHLRSPNIKRLQILLLNSPGFKPYFVNFKFPSRLSRLYGVTISVPPISQRIQCSMPVQSTLKLIFTLYEKKSPKDSSRFSSSPQTIRLRISSPSLYHLSDFSF